jgi:hypothetical protein
MKTAKTVPVLAFVAALGVSPLAWGADYGNSPSQGMNSNPSASQPAAAQPAANSNSNTNTNANATAPAVAITGTVQKVDKVKQIVQLKDATGQTQVVNVDANTQISRSGDIIQLAQLKKGDTVTVTNNTAQPSM